MSDDYVRWEGMDGSEAWEAAMSYVVDLSEVPWVEGDDVPWWVRELRASAEFEAKEAAEVSGISDVVRGPAQDPHRGRALLRSRYVTVGRAVVARDAVVAVDLVETRSFKWQVVLHTTVGVFRSDPGDYKPRAELQDSLIEEVFG